MGRLNGLCSLMLANMTQSKDIGDDYGVLYLITTEYINTRSQHDNANKYFPHLFFRQCETKRT